MLCPRTDELDALLQRCTQTPGPQGLAGVVAMLTDRQGVRYAGVAGVRELGQNTPLSLDAVFALYSTTKPLTAVCLMQLVEEGRLGLDDAAGDTLPEIDQLQVLEGFDEAGQPRTRAPKRRIRIRDLLLHTAGLGYEFFDADDLRYRSACGVPSVGTAQPESLRTVLLNDPGEAWKYGVSIDWLGRLIEAVRGQRLGEVMAERLFAPLAMQDIGFSLNDAQRARVATLHKRKLDGSLQAVPQATPRQPPASDMGGQGLFGTVGAYMAFIRMWLNDGAGPAGRVLRSETVQAMCQDGLAPLGLSAGGWGSALPALAHAGEFCPGTPKGWAYSFLLNREATATGRPAGSLMWAGLGNCHFWIDRANGLGGFWATHLLPFHDAVAHQGFEGFEREVYQGMC